MLSKLKVLLIDDDDDDAEIMKMTLGRLSNPKFDMAEPVTWRRVLPA